MLKTFLFALILCAQTALAQDLSQDLDFRATESTSSQPFSIPLYVDLAGNLNILSKGTETAMSFRPTALGSYNKTSSRYIRPVQRSEFSFSEQKTDLEWIQVVRKRMELGIGLNAVISNLPFSAGLTPYKGARQMVISHTKSANSPKPSIHMPKSLDIVDGWAVGDQGTYQTYGGVEVSAAVSLSVVKVVEVALVIQNLFSVSVHRLKDNKVQVSIAEEKLNKRRIQSGATVATATLNFFKGKRLTTHFILSLNEPLHRELYKKAIKGKLTELQEQLPSESQKMEWVGNERIGYIGVPGVAGKYYGRAEYKMDFDGEEDVLDIKNRRNTGIFVPLRNHNKLVYQSESALILFWFSEINKADEGILNLKFLTPGKIMGAKGFHQMIPEGTKIGSTLSQMGMSFTREELENVTPALLEDVLVNFKARCEEMSLSCNKDKNQRKIGKTLRGFLGQKWEDVRDKLGFLMLEEPALIHSYVKSIKAKKSVYFKFLNEKYQSLEGAAAIEI